LAGCRLQLELISYAASQPLLFQVSHASTDIDEFSFVDLKSRHLVSNT